MNQTHSVNSSLKHNRILVNFNIPIHLKENFDCLVKFKGSNRTSILVDLIQSFCRSEYEKIQSDNSLNSLIIDYFNRNQKYFEKKIKVKKEQKSINIPFQKDLSWESSY